MYNGHIKNEEIAVISVSSAIVGICILALMAYLLCRYLKMKDKDFSLKNSISDLSTSLKKNVKVGMNFVFKSCTCCFKPKVEEEEQKEVEKGEVRVEDKSGGNGVENKNSVIVDGLNSVSEAVEECKEGLSQAYDKFVESNDKRAADLIAMKNKHANEEIEHLNLINNLILDSAKEGSDIESDIENSYSK